MEILRVGKPIELEAFAYLILTAGTLGDHISTMIGLNHPYIYETNPITVQLMAMGLWLPADLSLIALGIAVPYLLIRLLKHPSLKGLLAYPLVLGAIRFVACIWNLSLIL